MKELLKALIYMEEYIPFQIDITKRSIVSVEKNELPWTSSSSKKDMNYEFYFSVCKLSELANLIIKKYNLSVEEQEELMEQFLQSDFITCLGSFEISKEGYFVSKSLKFTRIFLSLLSDLFKNESTQITENLENEVEKLIKAMNTKIFTKETLLSVENYILEYTGISVPRESALYFNRISTFKKNSMSNKDNKENFFLDQSNVDKDSILVEDLEENSFDKPIDNSQVLFCSYFHSDLKKVLKELENDESNIGKGLSRYLSQSVAKNEIDIENVEEIKKVLHPKNLPMARWISPPEQSLSLMQSVSVNVAINENLSGNIVSVNGPPGTGKTTLLKDIFAENIYKKASYLSKLPKGTINSKKVIGLYDPEKKYYAGNFSIFDIPRELIDLSMVVTSFNNKAVENISKDLPVTSKNVVEQYILDEANIFSFISNALLPIVVDSKDVNWGLVSATLGNMSNRKDFFEKFYKEIDTTEVEDLLLQHGLEIGSNKKVVKARSKTLLTLNILEEMPWDKAVSNFKAKELEVLSFIEKYGNILELLEDFEEKNRNIFRLSEELSTLKKTLSNKKEGIFDIFNTKFKKLKTEIASLETQINIDLFKINNTKYSKVLSEGKTILQKNFPSKDLWNLPKNEKEFQTSSPWLCKEFNRLRSELFVEALKLNKQFILQNKPVFTTALSLLYALEMKKSEILYDEGKIVNANILRELKKYRVDLYNHLFLLIPIVSCTFASFQTMFHDFGKESLGWLFIDEAGQALPQAAVGAIWRSKNTVIVGDPLQIEPVNPLPRTIFSLIEKTNQIKDRLYFDSSVQTFGDKINNYKGKIGDTIVGIPLKVHRRCIEPMFSIANQIAYDNKMIIATGNPENPPKSLWLHVEGSNMEDKYNKAQGVVILNFLEENFKDNLSPETFIISPFKNVVTSLQNYLTKYDSNWIKENIGTVHTFQGKECKTVILCLGLASDGSQNGARDWASSKPNLLNVAVTRAKHQLIIVGDKKIWKDVPYFKTAYSHLDV